MADTLSVALLLAQTSSPSIHDRAHTLIRSSLTTIARLETQIADLHALIAREHQLIAALQLVVAPVRSLPRAVLSRVFRHALPLPSIQAVLVLSHVCSSWRRAALQTPEIWVRLLPIAIQPDATRLFLQRSAPLPIPVSLGAGYDSMALAPLLDSLFAVPGRWRALTLTTKLLSTLAQIPSGALHSLEGIELRGLGASMPFTKDIFLTAPLLHRATFWQVSDTASFPLPWTQLTQLALVHDSPQVCLDVVLRCTNLHSATLRMSGWSSLPQSEPEPTTLPFLSSLEIHIANTSSSAHFTPFLQHLTLPLLTSLNLFGEYHSGVITWSPLPFTLFQLRAPLIAHLQIDHCALTSEDLQSTLFHAPALTRLEIYNCSNCIDDGVLAALRYTPFDHAPLVPRLEVLWLASQRCDFDESVLREMVESRWWADEELPPGPMVVRLKDVRYTSSRKFSRKFDKRMQVYKMEGLKFEVLVT
ncbi:hypothetical protein C8F01DRAFT_1362420 [Mycena amicta]|nr:hypothetical protein C8F01DRAFT_1362420 [Mycena amicta]